MKTKAFLAIVIIIVGIGILFINLGVREIVALTLFAIFIATMAVKTYMIIWEEEQKDVHFKNEFKYDKKLEDK